MRRKRLLKKLQLVGDDDDDDDDHFWHRHSLSLLSYVCRDHEDEADEEAIQSIHWEGWARNICGKNEK